MLLIYNPKSTVRRIFCEVLWKSENRYFYQNYVPHWLRRRGIESTHSYFFMLNHRRLVRSLERNSFSRCIRSEDLSSFLRTHKMWKKDSEESQIFIRFCSFLASSREIDFDHRETFQSRIYLILLTDTFLKWLPKLYNWELTKKWKYKWNSKSTEKKIVNPFIAQTWKCIRFECVNYTILQSLNYSERSECWICSVKSISKFMI